MGNSPRTAGVKVELTGSTIIVHDAALNLPVQRHEADGQGTSFLLKTALGKSI